MFKAIFYFLIHNVPVGNEKELNLERENMDKEEKKKLRKEYDDFTKKNPREIFLIRYFYYSIIASLVIFILPQDILTEYTFFKYFTEFMENIFPNIHIYAQSSKISELVAFYYSYMWLVIIIVTILYLTTISKENDEAKKYFGINEYQGRGILPQKYLIFYSGKESLFAAIALFILVLFALYMNYTGSLIDGGISRLRFNDAINTRFGIFFMVNIFQNFVNLALVGIVVSSIILVIHIPKIKKENN